MSWLAKVEERNTQSVGDHRGWLSAAIRAKVGARSGVTVNPDTALSQTAIWSGVNRISRDTASVPLKVYQRAADGRGREPVRDHYLWPILNGTDPNPEQTAMELRQMLMGFVLTHGNAYALIEREQGQVARLWPIVPWRVTVVRNPRGALEYMVTLPPQGQSVPLEPRDILHLRGFTRDGVLGVDTVHQMREAIGLSIATEQAAASFFGNGANPRGFLHTDNSLSEKAYNRVLETLDLKHEGPENWHKVAILEEGLQWQQLTTDPEQAQMIETRKLNVTEASRILLIPPHKLGDLERSTFSNVEQQEIDYWVGSLTPWFVNLEQRFTKQLLQPRERQDTIIEHVVEGRLRGDSAARAQFYNSLFNVAGISPNEIAERENMNPVEGGDTRFVPLNMMPVNEASQAIEVPERSRPEPEPTEQRSETRNRARALRAVRQRKRIERAHVSAFAGALDRMVRREVNAIRRALPDDADMQSFRAWLDEFYEESADPVAEAMAGPLEAFIETMHAVAREEVGDDGEDRQLGDDEEDLGRFAERWAENFGVAWTSSARNQIQALIREHPDPDDAKAAIEQRLEEWSEDRAEKEAGREVVEVGAEVAKQTWVASGVAEVEWVANPDACPLCARMDGTVVSVRDAFLGSGSTLEADGAAPLRARAPITRPQLHDGCDCGLAPSI